MVAFNPRDPAFIANPYPAYRRLRETTPVWRSPFGRTFLTRYEDSSCCCGIGDLARTTRTPRH